MLKLIVEEYNIAGVIALQCDVCGREIIGKPHRVIIEGAKLTTCAQCAKLGSAEWKPEPKNLNLPFKIEPPRRLKLKTAKRKSRDLREDITVIENFGLIVRKARQRAGLSQEDLGRRIGEKVSVIRKIEGEKRLLDDQAAQGDSDS